MKKELNDEKVKINYIINDNTDFKLGNYFYYINFSNILNNNIEYMDDLSMAVI